jgi:septal ring factor EnvC (AmiA/AmiB activator)
MQKKTASSILLILFTSLLAAGCDSHREERAGLRKQIDELNARVAQQKDARSATLTAIDTLNGDIEQQAGSLPQHSQRRAKYQDDLSLFLLDHKLATIAVIAAGGGAATFINDNIDEDTRNALRVAGLVGAIYCLANTEECTDVTARVLYFGALIENENRTIADITSRVNAMKTALQEKQGELREMESAITAQQLERDTLQQKHDSLVCSLCF